jgi:hypothetical protein
VIRSAAPDAAFWIATRTVLLGSMMPLETMPHTRSGWGWTALVRKVLLNIQFEAFAERIVVRVHLLEIAERNVNKAGALDWRR